MLSVLKFETVARVIATISVVICAAFLLTGLATGPLALLMSGGLISFVVMVLFLPLYNKSWFHKLYGFFRGPTLIYPVLDGQWRGEIESNWSIVKKMLAVSRGEESGPFDPLTQDLDRLKWDPPIPITANILSGFLDFKINVVVDGTTRQSETLSVRLDRTETGIPRLRYIFRQFDESLNLLPSDQETHLGAAELTLSSDGKTLKGRYWTDRVGNKGLNTAGRIVLRRVTKPHSPAST